MIIIIKVLYYLLLPFAAFHIWCGGQMALRAQKKSKSKTVSNSAEGTHSGRITRVLESDVTQRGLLVKVGIKPGSVTLCGDGERPIGVALSAGRIGDPIAIGLLGCASTTYLMVAQAAINEGDELYSGPAGRVQPTNSKPGAFWRIGVALSSARCNGSSVEVDPCLPSGFQIL